MRIELYAFGMGSIAHLQNSVRSLYEDINVTINSLQSAKNRINNLPGGAQTLQQAINQLDNRIRMESQKQNDIVNFNRRTAEFIEHAVDVDLQVSRILNQNQKQFFYDYSWLKPVTVIEKSWWEKRADDIGRFWKGTKETVSNAIKGISSFAREHALEWKLNLINPTLGFVYGAFFKNKQSSGGAWYSKIGEWFNSIKKYDEYDTQFFWEHPIKYLEQSIKKIVLGEYDEGYMTELSFVGNIVLGFTDIDILGDLRDFVYDIQHWGEDEHFVRNFILDTVALLPIVGVVKYFKHVDEVGEIAKTTEKISDAFDESSTIVKNADNYKTAENTMEGISNVDKKINNVVEKVDEGRLLVSVEEKIKFANNNSEKLRWAGDMGNSKRIPIDSNSELAKELKKYNIDGLYYKNGDIDFTPVSRFNYKFENADELYKSIGQEITIDRLMKADGVKGRDALNTVVREKWQSITKKQIVEKIANDKNFARQLLLETGIDVSKVKNNTDLTNELKRLNLTMHETPDCTQIQFIPTMIHDEYKHYGGTSEMLERIIDADTKVKLK